jgi:hypothetical protein
MSDDQRRARCIARADGVYAHVPKDLFATPVELRPMMVPLVIVPLARANSFTASSTARLANATSADLASSPGLLRVMLRSGASLISSGLVRSAVTSIATTFLKNGEIGRRSSRASYSTRSARRDRDAH